MNAAVMIEGNHRPHARIEAVERPARVRSGVLPCLIGRDLTIDPEALSSYCFQELSPRVDDLVLLAGVVAFADRTVTRRTSIGWGRDIDIVLPVHEPDFWRQAKVTTALTRALDLVTGDCWNFEFRRRQTGVQISGQAPLALTHGPPPIVMPYSDGLDSFALARLPSAREPNAALILVTTGRRKDADREWRERHLIGWRHRMSVPFRISDRETACRFRESSYRSRGFTYGIMAGIAAHLFGGKRIIVSESGQGALGPWLAPVGNEAPDVRTHPLFTLRLADFLQAVLGTRLHFEHPRLWSTKGETLRELAELAATDGWAETRSCARDARHVHLGGVRLQCGVCAACLLRRQSLLAAGLDEGEDRYFWRSLGATTLAGAAAPGGRHTSLDDERQAVCGALSLIHLADLASDAGAERIAEAADELVPAVGADQAEVKAKLRRLVSAHRDEWLGFVDAQGPDSFLARRMEQLRC